MKVTITIQGEDGIDAVTQLQHLLTGLQSAANTATKGAIVADKPKAKAAPVDEDEEEEVEPKKAARIVTKTKAATKARVEDEEEEAPKAKKKPEPKAPVGELKDNGEDQPATTDGCRIMIRRVARAQGEEYAFAVLAEFGVDGATKVPEKKMAKFIERCQEVIDDPENIELDAAE